MELLDQLQQALGGAYTVERELGGGGMSRVFLADETALGRKVVVKVLPTEMSGQVSMDRFKREIRLAASLQQANIVPIISAGDAGGMAYYTMPFVRGESLRARLTAHGALPIAECVAIFRDLAKALAYAHGEGIVHRDIKPDNVLLSGGTAVVTDFGIAKAVAAAHAQPGAATLTQLGMTLGTPAYMAPEQAFGDDTVDHRADLYALGVVAYELLAGSPPFAGRTAQAQLAAHAIEQPAPILERRPDAPQGLATLVMRCLEKDPARRPQSAREVLDALESVSTPGAGVASRTGAAPAPAPAIAVLPFANMSADPENEYFSDGITEELINVLTKIDGLRVVSRTSAFAFKGKREDIRSIGRQLGVSHVLEGSVRKAASRIRLTAQLIAVDSGYHLWSDTYDRQLEDVFAVQDELSRAIAGALKVQLLGGTLAPLVVKPTSQVEAYTLYLKGRYHWDRRTEAELLKGLENFKAALALDPEYALAWIGVADSYSILGFYGHLAPKESFPRAREAAERALALDDTLAAAHCSRGYVRHYHDWDFPAAEADYRRAIALDPAYATAPQFYGNLLVALGRFDEAAATLRHAVELEPLSLICNAAVGWGHYHARRNDDAIASLRATIELDPHFMVGHLWLGRAYVQAGLLDDAVREFGTAAALSNRSAEAIGMLGHAHAVAGRSAEARGILAEMEQLSARRYVPQYLVAYIYLALGEHDAAFARLERAFTDRAHVLVFLRVDPVLDPLRADSRLEALAKRVGL
jgi:eukaryotic-like serine/threonine-protein kinase